MVFLPGLTSSSLSPTSSWQIPDSRLDHLQEEVRAWQCLGELVCLWPALGLGSTSTLQPSQNLGPTASASRSMSAMAHSALSWSKLNLSDGAPWCLTSPSRSVGPCLTLRDAGIQQPPALACSASLRACMSQSTDLPERYQAMTCAAPDVHSGMPQQLPKHLDLGMQEYARAWGLLRLQPKEKRASRSAFAMDSAASPKAFTNDSEQSSRVETPC